MLKTLELRTVELSCPDELKKIILNRQPVKVIGLIQGWNATKWSLDYFNNIIGSKIVNVLINLPLKSGGILKGGQDKYERKMSFYEFTQLMSDDNVAPCYLGYFPSEHVENIQKDYDFDSYVNVSTLFC